MVKGDLCSEYLDGCDPQCQTRCESKHAGGQSSCDATTSKCKCYYQCGSPTTPLPPPPPKGKTCTVGIGPCSQRCNEECCNAKCAEKFPGDFAGCGICYSPGPNIYSACLCNFQCKN
ncbi:Defensin-like protein [Trema orientale]|uniref:Defensin-like protein n=1 Tax=Trema orientale TaxID=63057 RepID=A0A2P5EAN3_TREOI|nr:Defensin-like protein [Trema orientale]